MTIWITVLAALISVPGPPGGQGAPELERYEVVADESLLYVVTHRAGLLSFLGHEHAIVPEDWNARLCLAEPIPEGAYGSVVIRTESLVVDTDSARTLAGLGDGPGDEDRREIQRKMLGAEILDAERFPEIRLDLRSAGSNGESEVVVRGKLAVRGTTRDVELPVTVEPRDGGGFLLTGRLEIRQRDYGIEPTSIAGVVKVADEVDLHVRLAARPTGRSCGAPGPPGRLQASRAEMLL